MKEQFKDEPQSVHPTLRRSPPAYGHTLPTEEEVAWNAASPDFAQRRQRVASLAAGASGVSHGTRHRRMSPRTARTNQADSAYDVIRRIDERRCWRAHRDPEQPTLWQRSAGHRHRRRGRGGLLSMALGGSVSSVLPPQPVPQGFQYPSADPLPCAPAPTWSDRGGCQPDWRTRRRPVRPAAQDAADEPCLGSGSLSASLLAEVDAKLWDFLLLRYSGVRNS